MLCKSPAAMQTAISEEPPCEMNGNGIPVAGSSRRFTAMCMIACDASPAVSPMASSRPKRSGATIAACTPRQVSSAKSASTTAVPARPSCSPSEAKAKSEVRAATPFSSESAPGNNPSPVSPPASSAASTRGSSGDKSAYA